MSTIDKASLIQIPSGYKNGKLYSVKPNPSYGSEQISNGDFSDGSTGWTVTNGTVTDKYNASMTAYQNGIKVTPFTLSGTYKLVFDLTITSGSCKFDGGGSNSQTYTTSGRKELTITNPTKFEFNAFNLGWVGTLDNVSVKEVLVADGDFTFSRSSSATRVNSEGLIEVASVIGTTEEVTNGDFSDGSTGWYIEALWTISNGVANGNGANSSGEELVQLNVNTIGKKYKATFEVLNYVSGSVGFWQGSGITPIARNANGTYTEYFTATSSQIRFRGINFYGSIDNVSVKEVFENDVPRLDYSGGASCASLLLESQRTNTMLHSELFTDSVYQRTSMSLESSPSGVSPDGTTNAFKVNPSVNGSSSFMFQSSTLTGSDMTQSIFVKSNSSTGRFVQLTGSSGVSNQAHVNFDLLNGTIYDSTGVFNAFIEDYGNDWYRIGITSNTSATAGRFIFTIVSSLSSGRLSGTGVTTDMEFYIYGYQLENGAHKTSYIPTTSSTVTRTADVCNNAGTSATFNDSEGVLFAEIAALANDGTYRMISLSDGTATNRISFFYQNSPINTIAVESAGSGTNLGIYGQSLTITNSNKIAVKYKANDCALWVNGVEVATDTSFAAFSSGTFTELSFDRGDGLMDFYGKTKQLMTFDEALSDEELSDLTGQVNLSFNNLATFYNYTIL